MQTVILLGALILLVLALGLVVARRLRSRRLFWGYPRLRKQVAALEKFVQGASFRDGQDLVISGNLHGRRTIVRFSRNENLPGMILRMSAPATFDLAIGAKNVEWLEERKPLRSGDQQFDHAWKLQSNDAALAQLFVGNDAVLRLVKSLCCSFATELHVEGAAIELREATVPESSPGRHIVEHLQTMFDLGSEMATMPGADEVKLERVAPPRPTTQVFTAVLASIAICAAVTILANFERDKRMADASSSLDGAPQGIPVAEAERIPNLPGWRLFARPDYDSGVVQWLRENSVQPDGRIEGDFLGTGTAADHAYLLVNAEHSFRVVVVGDDKVLLDQNFPEIAGITKVPKANIRDIRIDSGSRATGAADGILLVRDSKDPGSGIVLSFRGTSLVSAVPQDFKSIPLEPKE